MTIKDSNFAKNVAAFFQDSGVAEKYMKLTKLEDKIKLIWTTPIMQVQFLQLTIDVLIVKFCFSRNS